MHVTNRVAPFFQDMAEPSIDVVFPACLNPHLYQEVITQSALSAVVIFYHPIAILKYNCISVGVFQVHATQQNATQSFKPWSNDPTFHLTFRQT